MSLLVFALVGEVTCPHPLVFGMFFWFLGSEIVAAHIFVASVAENLGVTCFGDSHVCGLVHCFAGIAESAIGDFT